MMLLTATAFLDDQDPNEVGWAYRLCFEGGHQESGPLDVSEDASEKDVEFELRSVMLGWEDTWREGHGVWQAADGPKYVWEASN